MLIHFIVVPQNKLYATRHNDFKICHNLKLHLKNENFKENNLLVIVNNS